MTSIVKQRLKDENVMLESYQQEFNKIIARYEYEKYPTRPNRM